MQVYNDELYHFGILGMKWGRRTKKVDFYNEENSKNLEKNILEKQKLRTKYDNGKISYEKYVKQHIQLGRDHSKKALNNAKKAALSSMTEKERKRFEKNTSAGKKQADILLEKIARGGEASLMDKISLYGYK